MKTRLWILTLGLTAGLGVSQDQNSALEGRVVALEAELDSVQQYLQAQAKSAEAMSAALDQSEQAGFTYGINPSSRKILLKALHDMATAARTKVPGAKSDPVAKKR